MQRIREHYQDKTRRDARYKELKAQGRNVIRSMSYGSCLHPQYVQDYVGVEKNDTGIGNTIYKTYFPKLYTVETI